MRSTVQVFVGGLFGSEGKGGIAAFYARPDQLDQQLVAVRVGGSQAGHTVYGPRCAQPCHRCNVWGHPWPLRHVPVAAVVNPDAQLVIAAGSEIDPEVLSGEVHALESHGIKLRDRLYIDRNATVITPVDQDTEAANGIVGRSGSTGKGVGAARAARVMRQAPLVSDLPDVFPALGTVTDTAGLFDELLHQDVTVQIEGTQGYGLGVHTRYYPHTTSVDCRAIDFLAMAGISPWHQAVADTEVVVVVRPNPIRIAGNSGPLKDETSWEALGLPPELTTVTRRTRRVGLWDPELAAAAVRANGGWPSAVVAIAMLDHVDPLVRGETTEDGLTDTAVEFIHRVKNDTGTDVVAVGTGPNTAIRID